MKDFIIENKKPIFIAACFLLLAFFLGFLSFKKIDDAQKIEAYFIFMPQDVTIKVDGVPIKNDSEILIKPGQHTLLVSCTGYVTYSTTISVSEYKHKFYGALKPTGSSDEDYAHEYDYFFGQLIVEEEETLTNLYPIYTYLPNNTSDLYSFTFDVSDDFTDFKVKAKLKNQKYYSDIDVMIYALKSIYSENTSDVDLSDYNIELINFNNPLGDFSNNDSADPVEFLKQGYQNISVLQGEESGDYYYTSIEAYDPNNKTDYMTLNVVLKKNGNSWKLLNKPYPILTKYNTSDIPSEILKEFTKLREDKNY